MIRYVQGQYKKEPQEIVKSRTTQITITTATATSTATATAAEF
jgi:hypothetical protein